MCLHKAVLPVGLPSTSTGSFLKLRFVFWQWCSKRRAFTERMYKMFQKKTEMCPFPGILRTEMEFKKFPFTLTLTLLPSLYKVCSEKKNNSVRIKTSFILVYFGSTGPMAAPATFWWGAAELYSHELPLAVRRQEWDMTRSKALKAFSALFKKHRMIQLIGMMI